MSIRHEARNVGGVLDDQQVAIVLHLSENFPWYAVLLARAVAEDGDAIARGDDEAARWNAGVRSSKKPGASAPRLRSKRAWAVASVGAGPGRHSLV